MISYLAHEITIQVTFLIGFLWQLFNKRPHHSLFSTFYIRVLFCIFFKTGFSFRISKKKDDIFSFSPKAFLCLWSLKKLFIILELKKGWGRQTNHGFGLCFSAGESFSCTYKGKKFVKSSIFFLRKAKKCVRFFQKWF